MTTTTPNTVKLGMTNLEVSPIAFGAWELGGE
jgi:aryl-alcohol dehydrogenase-like predicted oxidoreductase